MSAFKDDPIGWKAECNKLTKEEREMLMSGFDADDWNTKCWETGEFTDECDCYFCEHNEECNGGAE